ncbi:MAG: DNA gyrase inhibitor YacG [Xanthobacteraceae bacterium]
MSRSSNPEPSGLCPICRKPAVERFRPFCSQRCRDVDLNRWLSGVYAVPAVEAEDEEVEVDVVPPATRGER